MTDSFRKRTASELDNTVLTCPEWTDSLRLSEDIHTIPSFDINCAFKRPRTLSFSNVLCKRPAETDRDLLPKRSHCCPELPERIPRLPFDQVYLIDPHVAATQFALAHYKPLIFRCSDRY